MRKNLIKTLLVDKSRKPSKGLVSNCKCAFTLAEVLITLGIIGVVAALTLPTLIQNNKKAELRSQLKVAYSLLSQTIARFRADEEGGTTLAAYKIIKYFDHPQLCGTKLDDIEMHFADDPRDIGGYPKAPDSLCIGGQGVNIKFDPCPFGTYAVGPQKPTACYVRAFELLKHVNYTGISIRDTSTGFSGVQFVLKSGVVVIASDKYIHVDINGVNKRPNKYGVDLFSFQLMPNGKLLPMGAEGSDYTDLNTYCSKTSSNVHNGAACTNRALTDDKFWDEIKL